MERTDRHIRESGAAEHGMDSADDAGTVPVTVTGTCPTDGMKASDTVNIQVVPRVVQKIDFEDVYFDFDRFTLTDAAQRILGQALRR